MGTPHIGMGRDMSIFQIGESPYQYGAHSNLGTDTHTMGTFSHLLIRTYSIVRNTHDPNNPRLPPISASSHAKMKRIIITRVDTSTT